jgi:Mce-associated membrane protein
MSAASALGRVRRLRPVSERWRPNPPLTAALVLLLLAATFAGWSAWSWYQAAHPGTSAFAQARDQALRDGEQAVQNFSTLDYRTVGQGLKLWEQSSTGVLHSQIASGLTRFEQQVKQAKTVTKATVLDGALTSLDVRAGKATILAAVQIVVTPSHGSPITKQSRLIGQLTRTPSGWKLSALSQVPVGSAGSSGSAGG